LWQEKERREIDMLESTLRIKVENEVEAAFRRKPEDKGQYIRGVVVVVVAVVVVVVVVVMVVVVVAAATADAVVVVVLEA